MTTETYRGTVIASNGLYIRQVPAASGNVHIGGLAYESQIGADEIPHLAQ